MKKIIYFSDSKFPLANLAGAIHTGRLPAGKEPEQGELWSLPFLNSKNIPEGKITYLGDDTQGNKIYGLNVKGEQGIVHRMVESFLYIHKIPQEQVNLIDSGIRDNGLLLAGGLFCRFNITGSFGRYLTTLGVKKTYDGLTRLVADVQKGMVNIP